MCRREKISVKSNKIFSIQTFLNKTELIIEEHLPAIDIEEVKSSLTAYFVLCMFRMHSLFLALTLQLRVSC